MLKRALCFSLLLSPCSFAETGQQRMQKLEGLDLDGLEGSPLMQRIIESDLEKNLDVLADYYEQVAEKVDNPAVKKSDQLAPRQKGAAELKEDRSRRSSLRAKASLTGEPTDIDELFLQAKQRDVEVDSKLPQSNLKFRGRDPFAITEEMVRSDASLQASLDFMPDEKVKFTVPIMMMKGLVVAADGRYTAVLDIEGYGSKVVRKGDTIGLQGSSDEAAIRIKEITRLQIIVETGKLGKVIVVR